MVDGLERRRSGVNAAAITDLAQVKLAELAMTEAGLRTAGARQLDAVRPHVLIDVVRNGMRISMLEDPAFLVQQSFHHQALALFL